MKFARKLAGAGAAVALTAATLAVTAAPALATAYNGACGSGYKVIDKMDVGGVGQGTAYLTYNGGWNCVVTVPDSPGERQWMTGYFTQYAGPVYVYAPNACIDWGGTVGSKGVVFLEWNDHCG